MQRLAFDAGVPVARPRVRRDGQTLVLRSELRRPARAADAPLDRIRSAGTATACIIQGAGWRVRQLRENAVVAERIAVVAQRIHWLAGIVAFSANVASGQPPPVTSVGAVDLVRYVGKWYEIAAYPMYFQRQCVADTTAEYALRADGDIAVVNRCRTEDGSDRAEGRAWPVPGTGNAQLKVSFFWPFRSDYWILGLDADYQWAVVGHPDRRYLWVLSRTPRLSREQLETALRAAASQGFDLARLRYTRQSQSPASP
jgi:apolipoprotein D and lipocalin family protein